MSSKRQCEQSSLATRCHAEDRRLLRSIVPLLILQPPANASLETDDRFQRYLAVGARAGNPPAAEIQTEALPTQLIRCEVFILGLTSGRNSSGH
jgi:hypothetical protein